VKNPRLSSSINLKSDRLLALKTLLNTLIGTWENEVVECGAESHLSKTSHYTTLTWINPISFKP